MNSTTEIVTMKTVDGISKDDFINIVDGLEKNFHSKQNELLFNIGIILKTCNLLQKNVRKPSYRTIRKIT